MTNEVPRTLTVIVPAYNMEWCLRENLDTYTAPSVRDKISVIVLDNSSSDATLEIARSFEGRYPDLFTVITKENRGYGSSVNMGISLAKSKYLKVVDADDCVDADELSSLLSHLDECDADVVQTPYYLLDMKSGEKKKISLDSEFGRVRPITDVLEQSPFPSLHSTTLKTDFLKEHPFTLLEDAYYVDEELALYPFFEAGTIAAYDDAVYCYRINNDFQSVSPENKVKNRSHREKIIKRMMEHYASFRFENGNGDFCYRRIVRSVGDHFTTLYVLNKNKREGRREAKELLSYLKERHPDFFRAVRKKRILLSVLNRFHVSIAAYRRLKKFFGYKEYSSL